MFKLTHLDIAMLRFVIVGETYNTPHNKCSIATGMEWNTHKQVCKTLKQIGKQGMYVGRSSALKRIFA